MADYERVTEMNTQVENSVATLRWTGSWYTVFITAEPKCNATLTALPQGTQADHRPLSPGRPGHRTAAAAVSLAGDRPDGVRRPGVLLQRRRTRAEGRTGSRTLPDGTKGAFHPDNFTFGQTVYLSPIYAAARKIAGVTSVVATVFQPEGLPTTMYIDKGELPLGPFQIARLDNDPSLPDHGQLTLLMQGGK